MAKKKTKKTKKENAVVRYLRETRVELRKVHWPTRQEAWNLTRIVMIVTVGMALFLGFLDYLFAVELGALIAGEAIAVGIVIAVAVVTVLAMMILNRQRV